LVAQKTLLVEGIDDEHVFKHICGNRGVPPLDAIKPHGGVDRLLESIPVYLKASNDGDIVGVVVDADTDLDARWQALRLRLKGAGYHSLPEHPDTSGTILPSPAGTLLPRVGIWLMPDNKTAGILEDFLRFLVPIGSTLYSHVESSVALIPSSECRFGPLGKPKANIHTWLAWQEEPGKPLGTAITARYLDPDVGEVDAVVTWLMRLFFPDHSATVS
jgi:hypothetical protein